MTDDEILLVPSLPAALREAAQLGRLIPFIGAGASLLAGCPNWTTFANGALKFLVDNGKFTHAQVAQIDGLSPRIKLSLARSLQEEHKLKIDFKALLNSGERTHPDGRRLYAALSRVGKTFVTTNYDEWLDEELVMPTSSVSDGGDGSSDASPQFRNVFHLPQELTAANLNRAGSVLHLHGSVRHPDGMIVTTRDYVRHYANDRRTASGGAENPVLTFLEALFKDKVVLFVGYGLDELEILEYVILKTRDLATIGVQPRHFMLQGFFSHERELMLGMRRYYRECGIELLPFLKDHKGWKQLLDVLDDFAAKIPASELAVLEEFKQMEGLLNG